MESLPSEPLNRRPSSPQTESREPIYDTTPLGLIAPTPPAPLGPSTDGASTPQPTLRKNRRKASDREMSGFESVQDVIFESMQETQRLNQSRPGNVLDSNASIFFDTVKDLQVVASATMATLKQWTQEHSQDAEPDVRSARQLVEVNGANGEPDASHVERVAAVAHPHTEMNTAFPHLVWPFAACGLGVQARLPEKDNIAPHIHKVKEAVSKAVKLNNAASDIWKFAAGSRDDDDNTVGTLDTLQEESNQLRRLGSWGTVNTAGTGCTADTGFNSFEPGPTPDEIQINMEDDDGNVIDPVLLQKAKKTREKRIPRRGKVVKFDYPPIKSLRQCPRPDPEDLPRLFFTEHELDQIEDDRYSTMSTDDIEIVAVSSKAEETQSAKTKSNTYKSPEAKQGTQTTFDDSPATEHSPHNARDQPETGWKQARGRNSTPHRRRCDEDDDEEADFPTHQSKSPSSSGRLVKGVQIYLRERSTGA
jgi:hypothetical protein